MSFPPFNPFKSPNINFTNFTYNSSNTCQEPYSSYLALQTNCASYNYTKCCDELANKLNVVYDSCINNTLFSIILSDNNCKSLYIPEGFAHAYYSFSKENIIYYKLSNYYHPEYEDGILWNDKSLRFKWPTNKPILAKRDTKWGTFIDFKKVYKGF